MTTEKHFSKQKCKSILLTCWISIQARMLVVEEVGEALIHSLKRDVDGAAYMIFPDMPIFEVIIKPIYYHNYIIYHLLGAGPSSAVYLLPLHRWEGGKRPGQGFAQFNRSLRPSVAAPLCWILSTSFRADDHSMCNFLMYLKPVKAILLCLLRQ